MTSYLVTFNVCIGGFDTPITINRVVLASHFSGACMEGNRLVDREISFYLDYYDLSRTITGTVTKIEVLK